jgi:predicted deacylase
MPNPTSKNNLLRLVTGFWIFNLLFGLIVVAAWLWLNPSKNVFYIRPFPTMTSFSTLTVTPTSLPTLTINPTDTLTSSESPTATQTATETLTPIPFSEGPITIGKSVQDRPLEVYRFGTGPTERLIVAGIHGGNEYNTVKLAEQLMAYIELHPDLIPSNVTLYVLHDLNPDGAARALNYLGRSNANGVDLNRNWPANWQKDWPRAGCWTTTYVTGGTSAASEPETKALMGFIKSHHFDALISYHSAALGIFPGGLPPHENSLSLSEAIASVTTYAYPAINTGCDYTGDFTDWADINNIAALNIELTNHTDTDFDMNLRVLNVFLNWKR